MTRDKVMRYTFLESVEFDTLYNCFREAFSDYIVAMKPSKDQLAEMLRRRGANLGISVGAFDQDELVGFNLNGLDTYLGALTVYDIATGVIPPYRGRRIAPGLFQFSLPRLKETRAVQYNLEVISMNTVAFHTYESQGFRRLRDLGAFRKTASAREKALPDDMEIRAIEGDWDRFESFWDWQPSWQNSTASMKRSGAPRVIAGAFDGSVLAGYGIIYPSTGDIPQFAVAPQYRRRGIGAAILAHLETRVQPGTQIRVVNVPDDEEGSKKFLEAQGFERFMGQYEMRRMMSDET